MQATPPTQPAQGAPQAQPAGNQPSPAAQAIQMIEKGYQALAQMIQGAGGNLPPSTMKLFQNAVQATDALLEDLTSPQGGQGGPQPQPQAQKAPGGPMASNANANAQPAGPQGR